MPELLKPIRITDHEFLINTFAQCLEAEDEWIILDKELGSHERGIIDLLGVTPELRPHLITISPLGIEDGLIRCFKGYRWYRENQVILKRIFPAQDIDFDLSARLVLFIEQSPQEASKIAKEICRIPIIIYRYICFRSKDDPLIYIEPIDTHNPPQPKEIPPSKPEKTKENSSPPILNIDEIKARLKIELADLNGTEIQEFLNLDMP